MTCDRSGGPGPDLPPLGFDSVDLPSTIGAAGAYPNLLSVAGEWAGFDEEWLVGEVTKQARGESVILRTLVGLGIG
jgi:hypothetical protein